jgi:hypothetical protein
MYTGAAGSKSLKRHSKVLTSVTGGRQGCGLQVGSREGAHSSTLVAGDLWEKQDWVSF